MSDRNGELYRLLGVPQPVAGRVPWETSRAEVGFDFPADYRWFIDSFGSVVINKLLHIWSPRKNSVRAATEVSPAEGGLKDYVWLSSMSGGQGQMRLRLRLRHPETQPYPVWPEPGGLILWGRNERRHQCFWWTRGADSNEWPIVVWFSEFEWRCYEIGFSDFLVELLHGDHELSQELVGKLSPARPILQQVGGWND
jgi:hypothetical protein